MKALRWLTLIGGILLLVLGFFMFRTPVANLAAISIYLCITVLLYGIFSIISYFSYEKPFRSGWMLVVGILSVLLVGWVLFSGSFVGVIALLPYVFAIWLIASNISMIVSAIERKGMGIKDWGWQLVLGIIGVILGFILMFDPVTSALTISYSLAFMFVYKGISDIIFFFATHNIDRKES